MTSPFDDGYFDKSTIFRNSQGKTETIGVHEKNRKFNLPQTKDQWLDSVMKVCVLVGPMLLVWQVFQNPLLLAGMLMTSVGVGLLLVRR